MQDCHKTTTSASVSRLDEMIHGFEELIMYVKKVQSLAMDRKPDFVEVESEIQRLRAKIGMAATSGCLESYEPKAMLIRVDGKTYRKLGQPVLKKYMGLDGELEVERDLYREVGVRNGPTISPL